MVKKGPWGKHGIFFMNFRLAKKRTPEAARFV